MNKQMARHLLSGFASLLFLCDVSTAWAHAMPQQQTPAAGAELKASPSEIRIVFDDALEPAFSTLSVSDKTGHPVTEAKSRIDPGNHKIMTLALPALSSGVYRVHWVAVAHDGHRTQGEYKFQVK